MYNLIDDWPLTGGNEKMKFHLIQYYQRNLISD